MPPIHCHPSVTVWITNSKPRRRVMSARADVNRLLTPRACPRNRVSSCKGYCNPSVVTPTASQPSGSRDSRSPGAPSNSRCAGCCAAAAQQPDGLPTVDESYGQIGELRPRQQQHVGQHVVRPSAQRRADDDLACTPGQGVRQGQLKIGLILGGRRGDDRHAAGGHERSFVGAERVEIADQQVQRPAPGPRVGRAVVGSDHTVARRRRQACRRLRLRAAPNHKNAQCVLLVHHGTTKKRPRRVASKS